MIKQGKVTYQFIAIFKIFLDSKWDYLTASAL